MKAAGALASILLIAACEQASPPEPVTPLKLQELASEGCRCMHSDPQHRWWSPSSSRAEGAEVPPCWAKFDNAIRGLEVEEDPVAACGPGSEGVSVSAFGPGMPDEGAVIWLNFAFDACTQAESAKLQADFEASNGHGGC